MFFTISTVGFLFGETTTVYRAVDFQALGLARNSQCVADTGGPRESLACGSQTARITTNQLALSLKTRSRGPS